MFFGLSIPSFFVLILLLPGRASACRMFANQQQMMEFIGAPPDFSGVRVVFSS
jgi:hypothetical protein